jgi:hypothetical protein
LNLIYEANLNVDDSHSSIANSALTPCRRLPPAAAVIATTDDHCKRSPELVNVDLLLDYAREQAALGTIDALGNLSGAEIKYNAI